MVRDQKGPFYVNAKACPMPFYPLIGMMKTSYGPTKNLLFEEKNVSFGNKKPVIKKTKTCCNN